MLPGLIVYTVMVIYPIFSAMRTSLYIWNGYGPKVFTGLGNYISLFTDKDMVAQLVNAFGNSMKLFGIQCLIQTPLQIIFAYLVFMKVKGHRFAQALLFSTQLISMPIIALIFRLMLDINFGVVNVAFDSLGLVSLVQPWMNQESTALIVVFLMASWGGIGVSMLFLTSAMNMINKDSLEAAYIDGAGFWKRLVLVILPQIKFTVINVVLMSYIWSITAFDLPYLIGGKEGGINGSVDTMAVMFYRIAFGEVSSAGGKISSNPMGMGTAMAVILFFTIFLVSLAQVIIRSRKEDI